MVIKKLPISDNLKQWVESCIELKSNSITDFIPQTIGLPEASPQLVITLSGHLGVLYKNKSYTISKSLFFTYIDKPILVIPSPSIHIIKITFQPFGVCPLVNLTGLSSQELTALPVIVAEDIFGSSFKEFEEQLFNTHCDTVQQQIIEDFLVSKYLCNTSDLTNHMINNLSKPDIFTVDELCKTLHVTPRTLQRWFASNMGISPKFYLRLLRFKQLVTNLSHLENNDYLMLALDNGYYDQNHMIKETKIFTDMTPAKLLLDYYLPVQLKEENN